jgi:hypothetical protein
MAQRARPRGGRSPDSISVTDALSRIQRELSPGGLWNPFAQFASIVVELHAANKPAETVSTDNNVGDTRVLTTPNLMNRNDSDQMSTTLIIHAQRLTRNHYLAFYCSAHR